MTVNILMDFFGKFCISYILLLPVGSSNLEVIFEFSEHRGRQMSILQPGKKSFYGVFKKHRILDKFSYAKSMHQI